MTKRFLQYKTKNEETIQIPLNTDNTVTINLDYPIQAAVGDNSISKLKVRPITQSILDELRESDVKTDAEYNWFLLEKSVILEKAMTPLPSEMLKNLVVSDRNNITKVIEGFFHPPITKD